MRPPVHSCHDHQGRAGPIQSAREGFPETGRGAGNDRVTAENIKDEDERVGGNKVEELAAAEDEHDHIDIN